MIIGLTGGIASGKSTVSKILKDMDYKIFDADLIAKEIFNRKETTEKIKKAFLDYDIFLEDGNIDRQKIKKLVFDNEKLLNKLNSIIHPEVFEVFKNLKKAYEDSKEKIIFDIPLLFECNMEVLCDKTIVVIAEQSTQIARLIERDNIDFNLAKKIIAKQMPNTEKIKKADYIIENNGTLRDLKNKLRKITRVIV